jgi:C_GCAxxG_C_C family probable redox protein
MINHTVQLNVVNIKIEWLGEKMTNREERAKELYTGGFGYNCAQSVLGAFAEDYGLDMETALKLSNGFGGGVRTGNVCGAVSGALMALGLECGFHKENDIKQKGYCYKKTDEFIKAIREENGSILCRELLGCDISSPADFQKSDVQEAIQSTCPKLVMSAARILDCMDFV